MNKTISISIRVSEKDLNKLKEAAEIESYSSYSEFIRRTALIEADRVIEKERNKAKGYKEERLENQMANKKSFVLKNNEYYKKSLIDINKLQCEKEFWNVDETISELSYLTHDYFRYYGKFPSKIGKMILEDLIDKNVIEKDKDFIIDNYAGSGTSLVEAKLAGFDSLGFDINPFAVLACRVKTYNYDTLILKDMWEEIKEEINKYNNHYRGGLFSELITDLDSSIISEIDEQTRIINEQETFSKWFSENVIRQLYIIKRTLLSFELTREREFFDLGFFAIVRRVSRAHDAEVRPHVNKRKRERDAIEAFVKKINEMIFTMDEWNQASSKKVFSDASIVNNSNNEEVFEQIQRCNKETKKQLGAVLSHPPYLNCFDYISVYKLKFIWADGFDEIFGCKSYDEIKKSEIKSYPVNNDDAIFRYFEHNYKAYKTIYENLKEGGYCCIVIGDCTVKGELFSVHKVFISMMEELGFTLTKLAYRSTSYGMGRYAYSFRADYSENENSKQDAILFFKK